MPIGSSAKKGRPISTLPSGSRNKRTRSGRRSRSPLRSSEQKGFKQTTAVFRLFPDMVARLYDLYLEGELLKRELCGHFLYVENESSAGRTRYDRGNVASYTAVDMIVEATGGEGECNSQDYPFTFHTHPTLFLKGQPDNYPNAMSPDDLVGTFVDSLSTRSLSIREGCVGISSDLRHRPGVHLVDALATPSGLFLYGININAKILGGPEVADDGSALLSLLLKTFPTDMYTFGGGGADKKYHRYVRSQGFVVKFIPWSHGGAKSPVSIRLAISTPVDRLRALKSRRCGFLLGAVADEDGGAVPASIAATTAPAVESRGSGDVVVQDGRDTGRRRSSRIRSRAAVGAGQGNGLEVATSSMRAGRGGSSPDRGGSYRGSYRDSSAKGSGSGKRGRG
jgi:hypothetical protein